MLAELSKPKKQVPVGPPRNEKGGLLGLVLLLFNNQEIYESDMLQLNIDDKVILQSLLKRKFNIEMDYKWNDKTFISTINRDKGNSKSKRLEENYKLVFKKALKF